MKLPFFTVIFSFSASHFGADFLISKGILILPEQNEFRMLLFLSLTGMIYFSALLGSYERKLQFWIIISLFASILMIKDGTLNLGISLDSINTIADFYGSFQDFAKLINFSGPISIFLFFGSQFSSFADDMIFGSLFSSSKSKSSHRTRRSTSSNLLEEGRRNVDRQLERLSNRRRADTPLSETELTETMRNTFEMKNEGEEKEDIKPKKPLKTRAQIVLERVMEENS